jgi:hypothetical protein
MPPGAKGSLLYGVLCLLAIAEHAKGQTIGGQEEWAKQGVESGLHLTGR